MAVEVTTQALVAAFFFGIVLNAASAAFVLYLRGYGLGAVFRDSQRLVLILFLLSAALWALTDFVSILLNTTSSSTPCQIGIIFSTVFDQFARFSIEQFLLWALSNNNGSKIPVIQWISQLLVVARFLAGAVFIGFTRPQTDSFCVPTTSARPVGIVVTALDGVIILFLLIRAYSAGGAAKDNRTATVAELGRARALISVLVGLLFWTGVPGGLLIVIVFVACGFGLLLASRASKSRPLEAPLPRRINISRDISTSHSDYPPSRYEDLKEAAIRSSTTFVNPRDVPRVKDDGINGSEITTPSESAHTTATFPPKLDRSVSQKKGHFAKIAISHPILQQTSGQSPLNKIHVIDLAEAAVADKERRARMCEEEGMAVSRLAGPPEGMSPEEALRRYKYWQCLNYFSAALSRRDSPEITAAITGAIYATRGREV
ncbi:hypothetical protein N0V88_005392 [Collariella sp. IMI 366227]|nr:hypothetical protein N0V88_005392 [Collariella sp. IMI 366227]